MKFNVATNLPGYLRVRLGRFAFDEETSYSLTYTLEKYENIDKVQSNFLTGSILINYHGDLDNVIDKIKNLDLHSLESVPEYERDESLAISMNFKKNIANEFVKRFIRKNFIPRPFSTFFITLAASKYVIKGLKSLFNGKINVDVLDGAAIGSSVAFGHYSNAGSIMFLLKISDILEDYTKQKTRNALVSALSFKVDTVWIKDNNNNEKQISISDLEINDKVIVRTGSMIPVDGEVIEGIAGVNQASMTGESFPVKKIKGDSVFAGTVVTEGEILISVTKLQQESRIQNILNLVENSEALKSTYTANAEHIADRIVPYSFLFSSLVLLFTRDAHKALSALTVDYSCAIKLATPISVISAISEASKNNIMIKGGKYFEAMAKADTIVFDKTGTLTVAKPEVKKIIALADMNREEILRLAACLEEHYPHSLARAIVEKAEEENIKHREEHAEVKYIVSHGVLSEWRGYEARIGSAHFLFEDNGIEISDSQKEIIAREGFGYSCIYLSLDKTLVGVLCIQDPPRKEALPTINKLKALGIDQVIMLTGDGHNMAKKIAGELNIDRFYSEVLPENKAEKIEELQNEGHTVIMVGDGVNDTPALAKSNVSISLKDSSDIAREVADITLLGEDLNSIVDLRILSSLLEKRIESNFSKIFLFNTSLLFFGAFGIMQPTTTALLHNLSTAAIGLNSTRPYLKKQSYYLNK